MPIIGLLYSSLNLVGTHFCKCLDLKVRFFIVSVAWKREAVKGFSFFDFTCQ